MIARKSANKQKLRKFSWLQFDAPANVAEYVRRIQSQIRLGHLEKLEEDPHVTVLYGLSTCDPADVSGLVSGCGPIEWETGGLSVFKNKLTHVLKLDVHSPTLTKLNARLREMLPNKNTFAYWPHVTVAHLKPGKADEYADGNDIGPLQAVSRDIVLHTRNRKRFEIPLTR